MYRERLNGCSHGDVNEQRAIPTDFWCPETQQKRVWKRTAPAFVRGLKAVPIDIHRLLMGSSYRIECEPPTGKTGSSSCLRRSPPECPVPLRVKFEPQLESARTLAASSDRRHFKLPRSTTPGAIPQFELRAAVNTTRCNCPSVPSVLQRFRIDARYASRYASCGRWCKIQ